MRVTQHRPNTPNPTRSITIPVRDDEYVFASGCDHERAEDDGDAEGVLWCPDCRGFLSE